MTDLDDTVIGPRRAPASPTRRAGQAGADVAAPDLDDTVIVAPGIPARGEPEHRGPTAPVEPEHRGTPELVEPVAVDASAAVPTGHVFRVGPGTEPIPLDVPAYIGRRPSSPRIATGAAPRLVTVRSPQREVSSTHLEVREVGASVVITDLRSTNGSVVRVPGAAPRKLRQGESVVVSPGTLVDIGDGNIVEILPRRLVPGSGFSSIPDAEG